MIDVAVVGTGNISSAHLGAYAQFPERCRVVALCDLKPDKAEAKAAEFGLDVPVFQDAATMAAEGPLHEMGAIAIVNSDSQGMGRMMETVRRTLQLAHAMTGWSATAAGDESGILGPRHRLPDRELHQSGIGRNRDVVHAAVHPPACLGADVSAG